MGGKSYFCDYCCCYMKNNINVRKVHKSGLSHKNAKRHYYQDPLQLLEEESTKRKCGHFAKGFCKFDLQCQYSHYSKSQLEQLRKIVKKLEQQQQKQLTKTTKISEWKLHLPWATAKKDQPQKRAKILKRLPPSLKPINLNKINENCFNEQWG